MIQNPQQGLKAASQRGLVGMFHTLCRKCPGSRLSKQDDVGLSLMHYAAMYNRPNVIAILVLQSMDVNVRRNNNFLSQGIVYYYITNCCKCYLRLNYYVDIFYQYIQVFDKIIINY